MDMKAMIVNLLVLLVVTIVRADIDYSEYNTDIQSEDNELTNQQLYPVTHPEYKEDHLGSGEADDDLQEFIVQTPKKKKPSYSAPPSEDEEDVRETTSFQPVEFSFEHKYSVSGEDQEVATEMNKQHEHVTTTTIHPQENMLEEEDKEKEVIEEIFTEDTGAVLQSVPEAGPDMKENDGTYTVYTSIMSIDAPYNQAYTDLTSPQAVQIAYQLQYVCGASVECTVTSITEGSTVIEFDFTLPNDMTSEEFLEDMNDKLATTGFKVDSVYQDVLEYPTVTDQRTETDAAIKSLPSDDNDMDDDVRDMLEEDTNSIDDTEPVTGQSTEGTSWTGLSNIAKIGIAMGAIVLFWVILAPIVCIICRRKDKKREKEREEEKLKNGSAPGGITSSHPLMEEIMMTDKKSPPPLNNKHPQEKIVHKNGKLYGSKPHSEEETTALNPAHNHCNGHNGDVVVAMPPGRAPIATMDDALDTEV